MADRFPGEACSADKKHEAEEKTRAEAERETAYHRLATCSRRSDGDLNF